MSEKEKEIKDIASKLVEEVGDDLQQQNSANEADKVNTQDNSGTIGEQKNYFGKTEFNINLEHSSSFTNNDFTNLIEQNKPSELEPFFHQNTDQKIKELYKNRAIIIDCKEKEVAQSFIYKVKDYIQEKLNGKTFELRELSFDSETPEENRPTFWSLFMKDGIYQGAENIICLVRITTIASRNFFQGFIEKSQSGVRETLKKNNLLTIFSIEYHDDKNSIRNRVMNSDFKKMYWEISFLDYVLQKHIKQHEEIKAYKKKILSQREQGSWSSNENLFYKSLINIFRKGSAEFYKTVDSKIQKDGELSPLEKDKLAIKEIVKNLCELTKGKGKTLHRTVIYAATFFPDLKLSEFKFLVEKLITNKTFTSIQKIEKKKKKKKKKGKIKTIEIEKSCSEEWNKNTDKILRECYLTATYIDDSARQVIDFSRLEIRNEMKNFFSEYYPSYLQQKFSFLVESNILFDPATSNKIMEDLTQLVVSMAINDPEENGNTVLNNFAAEVRNGANSLELITQKMKEKEQLLTVIGQKMIIDAIISGEKINPKDINLMEFQEQSGILQELDFLNKEFRYMHFNLIRRFSAVINEMLQHTSLRILVQNFFSNLFYQKDYTTIYRIIELGRITTTEFDELNLIKKLLNNTPKDHKIRHEIYYHLIQEVGRAEENTFELLVEIYSWLQENPKSLLFLPEYATIEFHQLHLNSTSSSYSLFFESQSPDNEEETTLTSKSVGSLFQKRMEFYFKWLNHPKIKDIPYVTSYYNLPESLQKGPLSSLPRLNFFIKKLKEPKTKKNYLLNEIGPDHIIGREDLIEKWFMILNEMQYDKLTPKAIILLKELYNSILSIEDDKIQRLEIRKLTNYWREKKQFYLALLDVTKDKKLQFKIKLRRKIIMKLSEELRNIIQKSKV